MSMSPESMCLLCAFMNMVLWYKVVIAVLSQVLGIYCQTRTEPVLYIIRHSGSPPPPRTLRCIDATSRGI